jgi:cytochrome c biogenesis protein CcmG/thiol:disulfide interchange protein DsbE
MENETTTTVPRRLPIWVIAVAFVVLVGFLGLIAWGLRRANEGPIRIGDAVPPFTLTTFDGQAIQTDTLNGKVIVLNFWASWCIPCEEEAAALEASWQKYKPGSQVTFLGVDYVDTEPEALSYLDRFGITYPNGPDLRTQISQMFRIRGVPETYIIDREGKLQYVKIGPFSSSAELEAAVDPLLE